MDVLWRRAISMTAGLEARATNAKEEFAIGAIATTAMFKDRRSRVALESDSEGPCGQKVARTNDALTARAVGDSSEPLEMETVAAPVAGSKDVTVTRSGESEATMLARISA
jgi:hypothetical protein